MGPDRRQSNLHDHTEEHPKRYVPRETLIEELSGLLSPDDDLERRLQEADGAPVDPFA